MWRPSLFTPPLSSVLRKLFVSLQSRIYLAQQYEDVFCDCEECDDGSDEDEEAETESSDEANEEETQA